jgi:hypothetical protein
MEKILEVMLLSLYQKPTYNANCKVILLQTHTLLRIIEAKYETSFENMELVLGAILKKHGFKHQGRRDDKGCPFMGWELEEIFMPNEEAVKIISKLKPNQYEITKKGNVIIWIGTNYE